MKLNARCLLMELFYFVHLSVVAKSCSPGPRYGYRHPLRSLSPLHRGQYIPAISEKTIGASGPSEGRITRDSLKFAKLVHNYNTNIIFTDEERDGSDRIMTQRCRDRVDTLAILVANRWPGVKLQITDAWDSELRLEENSLRYEGRAVDFTTSDKDRSKYGMLARLAVEAGFDWVFYSSHLRVYASVRSDDSDAAKYGGCFPEESLLTTDNNHTISMGSISVGDKVLAADRSTGRLVYSDVIMIMDIQRESLGTFMEIATEEKKVLLTPNHMLFLAEDFTNASITSTSEILTSWLFARSVYAEDVKVGQHIFLKHITDKGMLSIPAEVHSVRRVVRQGLVAPLTRHGTLVVDGVVVSCYSVFKHEPVAHAAFLPVRTFNFFKDNDKSISRIHWYARTLSRVANFIFPESFFRLL